MSEHASLQILANCIKSNRGLQKGLRRKNRLIKRRRAELAEAPIDMLLFCPTCNAQPIDAPSEDWSNPPHKSHLCHICGEIWRPCDRPTNGIESICTKGSDDTWEHWRATQALLQEGE